MRKPIFSFALLLAAMLFVASPAQAQTIEDVTPDCATPGDLVLICGSDFAEEPTVNFGTTAGEVIRSRDDKILVRVPEGLEAGELTLDVDGATADFETLAEGAPVLFHVSAETATPGLAVFVIGRRLTDATVDFEDSEGTSVATIDLRGGRYLGYFEVPEDLAAGTYTLRITNGDDLDTGSCSPTLNVVEPGDPTLTAITPEDQTPGAPVMCEGTDLGPAGFATVSWTDSEGETLETFGFANGFDKVYTRVPFRATPGEAYDVVIDFRGDSSTEAQGVLSYTVGVPPAPSITELVYDSGPAGSTLPIRGEGFVSGFGYFAIGREDSLPVVEFTQGDTSTEADIVGIFPGFGEEDDRLLVIVPEVADGDYDVTVRVRDETSNAETFTVADLPLTVTSMEPDEQGTRGPRGPVIIQGTGFGAFSFFGERTLDVTWTLDEDGAEPERGFVLYHDDRQILVLPPGGRFRPLEEGTYTVRVVLEPQSDSPETAEAGTYTVR